MSILRLLRKTACVLLGCGLSLVMQPAARAAEGTVITAVSSRASDDYVRTKLQNGSFEPESYTFGEGGHWSGPVRDDTIDKLQFLDVARTIVGPLADSNYLPAKDPKQIKLLIMVYWGTTAGPSGASNSVAYQNLSSANQRLAKAIVEAKMPGGGWIAKIAKQEAEFEFDSAMAVTTLENRQRDKAIRQNAGILGYDSALVATDGLEFTALHSLR